MANTGQYPHFVGIDFEHRQGDLDIALFNSDFDLIREADGNRVDNQERISLQDLPASDYLVRITGHDNALNPNYTLRFLTPLAPLPDWAEENDQFIEAYDLGMVTGQRYWDGLSMSPSADDDWFKFTTSAESTRSSCRNTFPA